MTRALQVLDLIANPTLLLLLLALAIAAIMANLPIATP